MEDAPDLSELDTIAPPPDAVEVLRHCLVAGALLTDPGVRVEKSKRYSADYF